MDSVDLDVLLGVLEEPVRRLCQAEGRDYDEIRARGRWPAITTLSQRSGIDERKLRRMFNGEQLIDMVDADALLCAVGLGLTALERELPAPAGVYSEMMLTFDDRWPLR